MFIGADTLELEQQVNQWLSEQDVMPLQLCYATQVVDEVEDPVLVLAYLPRQQWEDQQAAVHCRAEQMRLAQRLGDATPSPQPSGPPGSPGRAPGDMIDDSNVRMLGEIPM